MKPVPKVLGGRYELSGRTVAAGGMGVIYDAHDEVLGRSVAVKVLSESASSDPSARRRFMREAHAAARISHPNAVAVFDAGEEDGRPYIVMELLSGRTIADEIKIGAMPAPRVRRLAREVLGVVAHAHSLGIIHRDIKPNNVLIDDMGFARVSDFGIAKTLQDDATRTHELLGTPSYVAPELFAGDPPSAQSDLFGVGVLLYEALTARRPFGSDSTFAIIDRMRRGEFVPLSAQEGDSQLRAAIERAMRPNPSDRFRTAEEMMEAIGLDEPVPVPSPSRTAPLDSAGVTKALNREALDATKVLPQFDHHWTFAPAVAIAKIRRNPIMLASAALGLVMLIVVIAALTASHTPKAAAHPSPTVRKSVQPSGGSRSPLPQPLDDALNRLQQAVSAR